MEEIWRELRERFPLLNRVVVQALGEEKAETFPSFFALFLAALEERGGPPCCFVLPRRAEMARLAAIMFGLSVFRQNFNSLAREYAEQKFDIGQRVRVHPSNHVFEFGGFWPDQPHQFRLCTLDGTGSRTFPANDVLRLEPTHLVTPRGTLATNILVPPITPLDEVLGVTVFGNLSLFKNAVLCLDEQSGFAEFANAHALQKCGMQRSPTLADLLPFGWLRDATSETGEYENWSARYPRAEPLVAVTSSAERLATFCTSATRNARVVVVNGLKKLSNPQAFDDIAASQRLILFADLEDDERMRELEARGCRFWIFGEHEFFSDRSEEERHSLGVFGTVVHRARNFGRLNIQAERCESEALNAIAVVLEELRSEIDAEAELMPTGGRLGRLAQRLWRLLNEAAGFCCAPSDAETERLSADLAAFTAELGADAFWLKPEVVEKLQRGSDALRVLLGTGSGLGVSKGEALQRAIQSASSRGSTSAVLTRSENQARYVANFLTGNGITVPVFSVPAISDDATFDVLILTSWPGSDTFRRLTAKMISAEILAVSYPFEARWLEQSRRRLSNRLRLPTLTAEEKSRIVTPGSARLSWPKEQTESATPATELAVQGFDVWSYEQRLKSIRKGGGRTTPSGPTTRARYISFVGESYAFLTQWHKVPVATHLVGLNQQVLRSLPERVIDDLKPGDLIVFPEGGQKAIIAEMADRLIGRDAHEVRKRSRLWREALLSSQLSPQQFLDQAKSYGHTRHIVTIRNWFFDEAQIGPGEREDLDLIAIVTESADLDRAADDVWDAISFLRSHHLAAGSALRDAVLQQLHGALAKVEENGSRIEVPNLGAAWVVQVDAVAAQFTEESRNQVDRLLWDQG